jgi:hypothetical protein
MYNLHNSIKTCGDSKYIKYNNLNINFSVFGMLYMLYNIDFWWVYTCFGMQGGIGCRRFSCFCVPQSCIRLSLPRKRVAFRLHCSSGIPVKALVCPFKSDPAHLTRVFK